jgi:hypothetical protein
MFHFKLNLGTWVALACFAATPLLAADEDRFSLSVGTRDSLTISGSDGHSVADLPVPTVAQNVTVSGTSLQVSYGRDANGQLTAILTAPNQGSVSLHFSAGGKSIDADKAVVTVTFSPDLKGVLVDPGYVGTVEVDSHVLRARSLADDLPVPASGLSDVVAPNLPPSSMLAKSETPTSATSSETASAATEQTLTPATPPDTTALPASTSPAANAPTPEPAPTVSSSSPGSLAPLASQITPILAPTSTSSSSTPAAPSNYESVQQRLVSTMQPIAPGATTVQKLYWSEPITSPDGSAPAVASNEIRLVEVHGTVTIVAPGGQEQTGAEGMLVPSGATVRTADSSSAALFMGGVNSARLMPGCELVVTQTLAGPVRTNVIDLKSGAVFSRIGHRDGETENYSVSTPEGVTGAEANDMMAFRGTPDDVRASSFTKARLNLDTRTLLAWNPAPTHGLVSDVPGWDLADVEPTKGAQKGNPNTYFYYCESGGSVQSDNVRHQVFCHDDGDGHNAGGGHGGRHDHQECKPQVVLQQILETLQPYNCKLKQVLGDIDSGTATKAEKQFYHKLTTVFFCVQEPGIVDQFENNRKKFDKNADVYSKILRQDLNEFGLPCLTPH